MRIADKFPESVQKQIKKKVEKKPNLANPDTSYPPKEKTTLHLLTINRQPRTQPPSDPKKRKGFILRLKPYTQTQKAYL